MKNLVLGSLFAALVSQATGCILVDDDDDPPDTSLGAITFNWELRQKATNQAITCPPGTTTARLVAQPVDANRQPRNVEAYEDLFDCDDHVGRMSDLPVGDEYQVWVELTNQVVSSVYAQSLSTYVDLIDADQSFMTSILNDGGYVQLQWDLVDSIDGRPLTCADAGATKLAVTVMNATRMVEQDYPCADRFGITPGIVADTYGVSVEPYDGTTLIGPSTVVTGRTVLDRNRVTDIGTLAVEID